MPTIMPRSELVRRAASWIQEELAAHDTMKPTRVLLDEAGMRFNLSPMDCRMLEDFFLASASGDTSPNPDQGNGPSC